MSEVIYNPYFIVKIQGFPDRHSAALIGGRDGVVEDFLEYEDTIPICKNGPSLFVAHAMKIGELYNRICLFCDESSVDEAQWIARGRLRRTNPEAFKKAEELSILFAKAKKRQIVNKANVLLNTVSGNVPTSVDVTYNKNGLRIIGRTGTTRIMSYGVLVYEDSFDPDVGNHIISTFIPGEWELELNNLVYLLD